MKGNKWKKSKQNTFEKAINLSIAMNDNFLCNKLFNFFKLLDTCTSLMLPAHSRLQVSPRMRRDLSQLLLIVSDGRGIFLEGMEVSETALKIKT